MDVALDDVAAVHLAGCRVGAHPLQIETRRIDADVLGEQIDADMVAVQPHRSTSDRRWPMPDSARMATLLQLWAAAPPGDERPEQG